MPAAGCFSAASSGGTDFGCSTTSGLSTKIDRCIGGSADAEIDAARIADIGRADDLAITACQQHIDGVVGRIVVDH